jgi:PrtD family type I secretion system ABC transporter
MSGSENTYLRHELREFMPALFSLLFFSFFITLLFLAPTIYFLQLHDRVLTSRNISTLISLTVIVVFLCIVWSILEKNRETILTRVAYALDLKIAPRVFDALNRQTDNLPAAARSLIVQDLGTLRDFVSGGLIIHLFDLVWVPLIVAIAFLFHFWIGVAILVMTGIVAALAIVNQFIAREEVKRAMMQSALSAEFARAVMRSAEVFRSMGMLPRLVLRWSGQRDEAMGWMESAARRTAPIGLAMRIMRHLYLPLMMCVGVILVLSSEIGAGIMFASTILAMRTLHPVDAIANGWRGFWNASLSAGRIDKLLREDARRTPRVQLPAPAGALVVSRIAATPLGRDNVVINDVSFSVDAGSIVGVVGASGAGKSSLGRVLIGAWPLLRGSIVLDGHDIAHWDQDALGRFIGYVPQDVDMLPGTIAENIARFEEASPETDAKVIAAVDLAGIQDIIAKLPHGLNTKLGPDGHMLSSGQRQRVALARAVYGDPRFLVLDEPNSNLDAMGEQSLAETIKALKARGAIVILVTHRMNMLTYCDFVLVMNNGTVHAFGQREQVVNRLAGYQPPKQISDRKDSQGASGTTIAA